MSFTLELSMHVMPLTTRGDTTSVALILETGDEVIGELRAVAKARDWRGCSFTAIGAFSEATLAYFDWETRAYVDIPIAEQVEVLALTGTISVADDGPRVHAHVVVGRRDGTTRGGHLKAARVRPTLEVVVVEGTASLVRQPDPESRLDLIRPVPADRTAT